MEKKWKVVKYSSSFYRKCNRARDNILNFAGNKKITNLIQHNKFEEKESDTDKSVVDLSLSEFGSCNFEDPNPKEYQLQELNGNEELSSETSDCDPANVDRKTRLLDDFRQWAIKTNTPHSCLKDLFSIVNKYWPHTLPKDPRTLLQTPKNVAITQIGEGEFYWHQGLEFCLRTYCASRIKTMSTVCINVNIDGLPIYKSSKDEFWPILFNIHECPEIKPMAIGIYLGKRKPSNIDNFLNPFVEEFIKLSETGLELENGSLAKVKIRCFIADSPARAFIKGR